jgi:ParB family chromosome partitioning protein
MTKSNSAQKVKLSSYEDIFKPENMSVQPKTLPISELHAFIAHPFKQYSKEKMAEMIESVRQYGVLMPILVRPLKDIGGYEIISGHNRVIAAREAGFPDIPATIREMDNETATIAMVDSNLRQRERLLPSEKAFAYKMKLDAMKRQGERTDITFEQVVQKLTGSISRDSLGEAAGESGMQVSRYIRLTNLISPILDIVDDSRMAFNPAVAISYLDPDQQTKLLNIMERDGSSPSLAQALKLKELSQKGELTDDAMESIMGELKPQQMNVKLNGSEVLKYFPPDTTAEKIYQTIIKLLEIWHRKQLEDQPAQDGNSLETIHIVHELER